MNYNTTFTFIGSSIQAPILFLYILFFFFFLHSCAKSKVKSLESYGCSHCKSYLDNRIKFEPRLYLTKNLKTLGSQSSISDNPNYDKLAEVRFKNKEAIYAVDLLQVDNFIENIHCLIGLDLETYKSMLPSDKGRVELMNDSTLLFSITVDTVKNNADGELVWAGAKSIYSKVKKVNGKYIIVGTKKQRYLHDMCISRVH